MLIEKLGPYLDDRQNEWLAGYMAQIEKKVKVSGDAIMKASPDEMVVLLEEIDGLESKMKGTSYYPLLLDLVGEHEAAGKYSYFKTPRAYYEYCSLDLFKKLEEAISSLAESRRGLMKFETFMVIFDTKGVQSEEDLYNFFANKETSPFELKSKSAHVYGDRMNGAFWALALERPDFARPLVEDAIAIKKRGLKLDPEDPGFDEEFGYNKDAASFELKALNLWLMAQEANEVKEQKRLAASAILNKLRAYELRRLKPRDQDYFFDQLASWPIAMMVLFDFDKPWEEKVLEWRFIDWCEDWCTPLFERARAKDLWMMSPEKQGWPLPDEIIRMKTEYWNKMKGG